MESTEHMKSQSRHWFEALRGEIVQAFEQLEDEAAGPEPAGRFVRTPWTRENDGGVGGVRDSCLRSGEIGVVQEVEGFYAKLQSPSLTQHFEPGIL